MMCLDDLGKVDGPITFDVLAVICVRIPSDLIGEIGVCADVSRMASHKIRLNVS